MFQKILKEQAKITFQDFENYMQQSIEKKWKENTYNVLRDIYYNNNLSLDQKITVVEKTFSTSGPKFKEAYIQAIKSKNFNIFQSIMGKTYEPFLQEQILAPLFDSLQAFAGSHIESMVSGAEQSISSVTSKSSSIRSDLLIYMSGTTFQKDQNNILRDSNSKLPLELTRTLEIDWSGAMPAFRNENEINENIGLFDEFLTKGDFFGFSAKVHDFDVDNKRFSNSSIIQDALNSVFYQPSQHSQQRHSWELDYANIYVIWNLSRVIKNIISPTTIAMTYGNKLMWMDDFLSKKVFYMDLQYKTQIGKHEAGEGRFFPGVRSSVIATKNFDISKGIGGLNAKTATIKNRFKKEYQGIKISLTN